MRKIVFEINGTSFPGGNFNLQDIFDEHREESRYVYNRPENFILIGLYIPVFLMALITNLLVIMVFFKYRSFRTVTNCFLLNLSIADLFVTLICMPAAVGEAIHSEWLFGDVLCRVTHYLQGVSVSSSVFTLTCMSVDRYLAICHPLKRKNFITKRETIKVILTLWTLAVLIFAPLLYVRQTDGYRILSYEVVYCVEIWPTDGWQKLVGSIYFLVVFAIPGPVIILAYSLIGLRLRQRSLLPDFQSNSQVQSTANVSQNTHATFNVIKERRKVAKTLMILALAFAVCWLPSSVLSLWTDLQATKIKPDSEELEDEVDEDFELFGIIHQYFILLGHFNSLLNPLLYTIMTKNFRNHVKDLLQSFRCCRKSRGESADDEGLEMYECSNRTRTQQTMVNCTSTAGG